MGNSSSSGRGHHDESVDYGTLVPQGVYTGPRDWNQAIVSQLIVARKLAPFYRPLEDYEDNWDDDQILAARKELPDPDNADTVTRIEATAAASYSKSKRPGSLKEPAKPEAQVYRGAIECPICFLYYPPNINRSRCCDQAICTECFVQIKRAEPTPQHLVSEYAACPYCVQENFGVIYAPPPWRTGLGSDGSSAWPELQRMNSDPSERPTHKRRQKSFGADSPDVVTTDQIRPDWESKLEAIRAAVARRANRRIIMRQVGDRLIPVGVTSGRVHPLSPEEAAAVGADAGSGRRRRGRGQPPQGALEQFMGMPGQDLEELMLMEAMRLSLLDHEEHQRKEAEEKKKQKATEAAAAASGALTTTGRTSRESASSPDPSSGPAQSSLDTQSSLTASSSANVSASPSSQGHFSPRHSKVESQDSLAPGRKSWSISRSRTPPPPPPNPAPNVPQSEENQTAWRNRSSGPPPFSTLSAALTSTSTAAAFLGAPTDSRLETPDSNAVPTITVVGNEALEASGSQGYTMVTDSGSGSTSSSLSSIPGEFSTSSVRSPASSDVNGAITAMDDASVTSSSVMSSSTLSASDSGVGNGLYSQLPSSPELVNPLLDSSGSSARKNATDASAAFAQEVSR